MKIDGFIGKDAGETHESTEFAVLEPNQIKHVANLGTWNPNNPNIYKLVIGEKGAKSLDVQEDL